MELIEDARAIQAAGAFSILVEAVPPEVCRIMRDDLKIPVYSIGAGIDVDGQLMICSDVLGVFQAFTPMFVKKYENIADKTIKAFTEYVQDVRSREFPNPEHTYRMVEGELTKLEKLKKR
jgi:3-methyl-2-oxobutanoate hydroxymethyltransferase